MKKLSMVLLVLAVVLTTSPAGAVLQTFTRHTVDGDFNYARDSVPVDLDMDGDLDIVATAFNDGTAWYENDGAANFIKHVVDDTLTGVHSVVLTDLDGDDDLDMVVASYNDYIVWYESTPSGDAPPADPFNWAGHTVSDSFQTAISAVTADFDGDGDPDILGAARDGNDVAWWQNNLGDPDPWTMFYLDSNFDGPGEVEAADIDGDGDMDALALSIDTGDLVWWENTPDAPIDWVPHTIDPAFTGANDARIVDLDKDGDLDVIGAAGSGNEMAWWESTPSGAPAPADPRTWTKHVVDDSFAGSIVNWGDVDRDGDRDLLGCGNSGTVAWWDNNGSQVFTRREIDHSSGSSISPGDLDGDGDTDLAGTYQYASDVKTWENVQAFENGSFETGPRLPAMWKGKNLRSRKDRRVTNVGKWGEASFRMVGSGSSKHLKQSVTVPRNDLGAFYISAWSKAKGVPAGGGPYKVEVKVFDEDGSLLAKKSLKFRGGTHKWQYKKTQFNVDKGYGKITVFVRYGRDSGRVWFDNVQVVHIPSEL